MFHTSRFLQVVILAYLFNLLIVACGSLHSSHLDYSRNYQLHHDCSHKLLEITHKKVRLTSDRLSSYTQLEVVTVDSHSHVHIVGNKSGKYLCFNKKGKLITRHSGHSKLCQFEEILSDQHYTEFRCAKKIHNSTLYMGFDQKGKPMKKARNEETKRCYRFMKMNESNSFLDKLYPETGPGPGPGIEQLKGRSHRLRHHRGRTSSTGGNMKAYGNGNG